MCRDRVSRWWNICRPVAHHYAPVVRLQDCWTSHRQRAKSGSAFSPTHTLVTFFQLVKDVITPPTPPKERKKRKKCHLDKICYSIFLLNLGEKLCGLVHKHISVMTWQGGSIGNGRGQKIPRLKFSVAKFTQADIRHIVKAPIGDSCF